MPPLPTLPTELINEILLERVLSTSDLARCCLVSRQFLPAARQLLYHSIQFRIYSDLRETGSLYALSRDSRVLCNTLTSSTSLASLVRRLRLQLRDLPADGYMPSQTTSTRSAQMALCFATPFPRLERLSLPELADCDPQTLLRFFSGRNQTLPEICLEFAHLARDFGSQAPPLQVKKLRCLVLTRLDEHFHLPALLTVLDIDNFPIGPLHFHNPHASRLEVVRLPIHAASTSLSGFKHLRHVVLHQRSLHDVDLTGASSIADCSSLKTLAFKFLWAASRSQLLALLLASPASLTRLEFSGLVPFAVLALLLDPSVRLPFRLEVLALRAKSTSKRSNAVNVDTIRSHCAAREIKIELTKGRRDVFYV
ncbi:hypothetical protein JCM11491_005789 [Sporobolomyces phaffii]